MCIKTLHRAWREMYGSVVFSSNHSVQCTKCHSSLIGDGPAIEIECRDCFVKNRKSGLIVDDSTVCCKCAGEYERGIPVTNDTHPDGFTCADCGEVIIEDN